ncbi:MAG: hypothetical protein HZC43_11875 [Nitrosomonadales bacterium]|nr:hypothetical protein [Nitrosomonadales bacterium]
MTHVRKYWKIAGRKIQAGTGTLVGCAEKTEGELAGNEEEITEHAMPCVMRVSGGLSQINTADF